jgi:hypothetical protein
MTTDLFSSKTTPPKNKLRGKTGELAAWIAANGSAKTSDVAAWGVENYYVSAVRVAFSLAEKGYLRRLSDEEVKSRFGHQLGQGVWVPTDLLKVSL